MIPQQTCPHCGSLENFHKVAVLFDSETSIISTSTKSVGVGVSGSGVGVGVGSGKTQGTIESNLAKKLKPPPEPTLSLAGFGEAGAWIGGILIIALSAALGYFFSDGEMLIWVIAGPLGIVGVLLITFRRSIAQGDEKSMEKYLRAKKARENRWYCKRCGAFTEEST